MPPSPQFKRGAKPSPRHKLLEAAPHVVVTAPPPQWAYVPPHLSMWGNDQHGDCVTAEEAFAKACYSPEIFIDDAVVIGWASRHGVLEGASLTEVLDAFAQRDGFAIGGQEYGNGPYYGVNYADEIVLRSAVATGPVKIAIDADALPVDAGRTSGWYSLGTGRFTNTDHCVSVCGFGPAGWLYQQMGVPLPAGLPASTVGFLIYTWNTIGFVVFGWIQGTCVEAWVRNPTTVGVPPLPGPTPPPGPGPSPVGPTRDDVLNAADRVLAAAVSHARPVCRSLLVTLRNDVHRALQQLYGTSHDTLPAAGADPLAQIAVALQSAREGIDLLRKRLEYALTDTPAH